uniref:Putative ixodes 10 kDa peptide protein n=1 Tax=Ixodes ricinus TaxID=34613 RepID=A0A0K8R2P5_IXORI
MQLVVFTVVLILPSFLSGESYRTIDEISNPCEGYLLEGGHLSCSMKDSTYVGYNLKKCTVICANGEGQKLPEGICGKDELECTSDREKELEAWYLKVQKKV